MENLNLDEICNEIGHTDNINAFIEELVKSKSKYSLSWVDISRIVELKWGFSRGRDYYRRNYGDFADNEGAGETFEDKMFRLTKLKMQISDERIQANAYMRKIAREETIKEIAKEATEQIAQEKELLYHKSASNIPELLERVNFDKEGILCLSDWHYGIVIDSFLNKYNPEIAKERLSSLLDQVKNTCIVENIHRVHVLNLGDLICGRIHLTLRLQSRIDVITQLLQVSEMLSEFLDDLSSVVDIDYYDCLDNHSRIEPNKADSLDLESLSRVIPEYVKNRLQNNTKVKVNSNTYGPSIISFESLGHKIIGLHGHDDKPQDALDDISLLVKENFDLMCIAHYHHFSGDEKNESVIVGNGTLMGTDNYAEKKRLSSKPSQNFIIMTEKNVIDSIKRILV